MQPPVIAHSVLDELATPVLRLDDEGRISDANAALASWLGISRRQRPSFAGWGGNIAPEDRQDDPLGFGG